MHTKVLRIDLEKADDIGAAITAMCDEQTTIFSMFLVSSFVWQTQLILIFQGHS